MVSWQILKSFYNSTSGATLQGHQKAGNWRITAALGTYQIECAIPLATPPSADQLEWETTYLPKVTTALKSVNARGEAMVEVSLRVGKPGSKAVSIVSPDLTDKSSWYQKSLRVTDEALVSLDLTTYSSLNPLWINMATGKATYSYKSVPKRDGSLGAHDDYKVIVKVNGVAQAASTYTVNYTDGKITFSSARTLLDVVTASYSHINGVTNPSEWLLVPPAGKKYVIEHVELQFSRNVGPLLDTIRMEVWAGATTNTTPKAVNVAGYGGFADNYFNGGYGQLRADYRNIRDLINAANQGTGFIPACGELTQDVLIFPFNYVQAVTLDSAVGTLIRLLTIGDKTVSDCELATATFYLQIAASE